MHSSPERTEGGGRQRVRAHLGGNDSPLKADLRCARASQIFSRCLDSGAQDHVIALAHSTGSSPLTGDASSDCSSVKTREWAAWLMGIQSENVLVLLLEFFGLFAELPLCQPYFSHPA